MMKMHFMELFVFTQIQSQVWPWKMISKFDFLISILHNSLTL